MNPGWTTPRDVRVHVQRLWDNGRLLRSVVAAATSEADATFPLRIPLRRPTTAELAARFADAQAWIAELRSIRHTRLEWRTANHRQLGPNEVPASLWLDTLDDAAALIGHSRDVARFRELVGVTLVRRPELTDVLARTPLDVLAAADAWPRLLDVVDWFVAHPRPGVYLRQIDVPGVHTKFVEVHHKLLARMLDAALGEEAVDRSTRPGEFARRYGLLERPRLVRFRFLDPALRIEVAAVDGECALTPADLARLTPPARVIITENEINYLSLPEVPGAIAVFGAGSGLDHLAAVAWLRDIPVLYWGDIDTHGFAILDQLRVVLPEAQSLMMDHDTLMAHQDVWGTEDRPTRRDLPRLTADESRLYDDLRDNRIRPNLRLEQEHIRFPWVRSGLQF